MSDWIATSETGTTYSMQDGIVTIKSSRTGITVIKPWAMKSALRPTVLPWEDDADAPMWTDVAEPMVGQRFYVGGKDEWRISTNIETVVTL